MEHTYTVRWLILKLKLCVTELKLMTRFHFIEILSLVNGVFCNSGVRNSEVLLYLVRSWFLSKAKFVVVVSSLFFCFVFGGGGGGGKRRGWGRNMGGSVRKVEWMGGDMARTRCAWEAEAHHFQ